MLVSLNPSHDAHYSQALAIIQKSHQIYTPSEKEILTNIYKHVVGTPSPKKAVSRGRPRKAPLAGEVPAAGGNSIQWASIRKATELRLEPCLKRAIDCSDGREPFQILLDTSEHGMTVAIEPSASESAMHALVDCVLSIPRTSQLSVEDRVYILYRYSFLGDFFMEMYGVDKITVPAKDLITIWNQHPDTANYRQIRAISDPVTEMVKRGVKMARLCQLFGSGSLLFLQGFFDNDTLSVPPALPSLCSVVSPNGWAEHSALSILSTFVGLFGPILELSRGYN